MTDGEAEGHETKNPLARQLPSTEPDDCSSSFFQRGGEIDIKHNRLPHWQQGDVWCFVTWRLGDSLPAALLRQWRQEKDAWLKCNPRPWDVATEREYYGIFMERIDGWLDKGMGSCLLRDSSNAEIVAGALRHFDGERCDVASFVVMPNHVHVLFRPLGEHKLRAILQSWKGFTAREINKRMNRKGALWQEDYWDRLVRSNHHFEYYFGYIKENPNKAGLKPGEFIYFEKDNCERAYGVGAFQLPIFEVCT